MDVGDSEDEEFWTPFCRGLKARGLGGVQLVISDAHYGLKHAIAAALANPPSQASLAFMCKVALMATTVTEILNNASRNCGPGEILWSIRSSSGGCDISYGDTDRPFFIASATKLYVTAILAQLRNEGVLSWESPIAQLLPELSISGLVGDATVREVMAHTSGLGDYFEAKRDDGLPTFDRIVSGDFGWDVNDVVTWTHHVPSGVRGKSLYSDTGYQLLGALIERLDRRSFEQSVRTRIVEPLSMGNTYVFSRNTMERFDSIAPFFNGDAQLRIPLAMASVQADGGIVSTLNDGHTFIDAFFAGRLFPAPLMTEIAMDWHRIFRPLEYGTGIMRFKLPRVFTGFRSVPAFIGHSGATGTVMYRCPERQLTVVGTINQVRKRSMPYRLMVRTALAHSG